MRMRFKPYARPELAAWPNFIDEPTDLAGKWHTAFENPQNPMRLELGCGKGGFIAQAALRDGDVNYLGIDIKSEVLVVAKRTIEKTFAGAEKSYGNALITSQNIEHIHNILTPQDAVDRIYINFCNPWYKSGHAKHRLTHPRQLVKYRAFLQPEGEIWFKTDDDVLFNDSLRYFAMTGFEVTWHTRDLHAAEPQWNLRTEHEKMFSDEGIPIKACIARMHKAELDEQALLRTKDV